jgi:hypothetical protein
MITNSEPLSELADVYFSAAELETELIGKNREKLRQCRQERNDKEETRVKTLLCLLYRQKREMLETANYLKNYYRLSCIHPVLRTGRAI